MHRVMGHGRADQKRKSPCGCAAPHGLEIGLVRGDQSRTRPTVLSILTTLIVWLD